MKGDIKQFAEPVIASIKGFIDRQLVELKASLTDALENRIKELPTPKDGAPGLDGKDGAPGEKGELGIAGKDGERGLDGKDGEPGKDGAPGEKGSDGSQGEKGIDGASGIDGRDGREGKDGSPGRDALQIDILPAIDETRSYARGMYACFRGGVIRSFRTTDPIGDNLESSGWAVIMRGIDTETEEFSEDGRTEKRITRYTDGAILERSITRSNALYRGIWKEATYAKGDMATRDGCTWHANKQTDAVPGSSDDWQMCVKKGRDGRDGLRGEKGERGAEGRAGKDLTQKDALGNKW